MVGVEFDLEFFKFWYQLLNMIFYQGLFIQMLIIIRILILSNQLIWVLEYRKEVICS